MSRLLSIDPGVRHPGAALFDAKGKLIASKGFPGKGFCMDLPRVVSLATQVYEWARFEFSGTIAMEWPQVYAGRQRGRKDPNDLLPLAAFDGALAVLFRGVEVVLYKPHDWKGSKQANPTARWVLSRLSLEERVHVEHLVAFEAALSKAEDAGTDVDHPSHDVVDAAGIGLHHLGRLGRHRVIAR